MGQKIATTTSFNLPDGREIIIETGKLAEQAHGAVVVKMGDTMVFASVVSSYEPKPGQSFFPLSVDYQEKFAAAGKIPGNFFRREARLNEHEILTSRLVDRALRPLFPDGYMNETQIVINLISADLDDMPDALAALAASAAISVSNIQFAGPISEVRIARINGEFKINPKRSEMVDSDLDIILAATMDNVMMVEGEMDEVSEADLIEAIKYGHEAIKVQCQAQLDLAQKVGEKATVKRVIEAAPENEEAKAWVRAYAHDKIYAVCKGALDKFSRKDKFGAIKDEMKDKLAEEMDEAYLEENMHFYKNYYNKLQKEVIREMVMAENIRLDGRKLDEVRNIWTEISYLPSAHGSAIFTRGETQALTSMTLGTKTDQMLIDTALDNHYESFILHYNFPALSVGEARMNRGPGRREIGHANLAGRSIKKVMPEEYPYTVRLVSDILESNGSSSMATVCAGSLALMDGGVPIRGGVSGIAMGMVSDGTRNAILSDILGDEDAVGDMDFKVTGTRNGIVACQMDIKVDGLPYDILQNALDQAKVGRLHILDEMNKTIEKPADDYKPHAPRMVELKILKKFIGAVIGPGGKVIQEMQRETNTIINIEEVGDEGVITISSSNKDDIDAALATIKKITYSPEVGDVYDAKVASVQTYGVFVDFMGQSGLLHVSEISHSRVENVADVFKEGDDVKVKLVGIDPKSGKYRLSRKALMSKDGSDN